MAEYDFGRPFTRQECMPLYSATDSEVAADYGRIVRALRLSNAEYDIRYRKFNTVNNMRLPPGHSRIFAGYLVVRNLATPLQYETWMPDRVFEGLYVEVPGTS